MIAHGGCFNDYMQSLMHVPFEVCHVPHVQALKLIIYSSCQSPLWDQRAIAFSLFLAQ